MTWLVVKTGFSKFWIWLKEHWEIPFLVVWTALVYVLSRRNTDALIETIEAKRESYKKQIEVLKRTHNDEILERDSLIKEYQEALSEAERGFEEQNRVLLESQREEIKELVIKSKGDPEEIKRKIEKEFDIKYVE